MMAESENLPIEERTKAAYLCSACGANISMVYLRPESEKVHNRPMCESCGVPMARLTEGEDSCSGGER